MTKSFSLLLSISTALLVGCAGAEEASTPCGELCNELVANCAYGAYPDMGSCLDGCAWSEQEGADITGHALCVMDASCDTFDILECEHEFGE